MPLDSALTFLPEVRLAGEPARRASHGVAVESPGGDSSANSRGVPEVVRLVDEHGLIALAEPRADGRLKPIVGFRS